MEIKNYLEMIEQYQKMTKCLGDIKNNDYSLRRDTYFQKGNEPILIEKGSRINIGINKNGNIELYHKIISHTERYVITVVKTVTIKELEYYCI